MPTVTLSPIPLTAVPVYDRLRDEFAMAALTGLLAARFMTPSDGLVYAKVAYALADAMLKQREAP
jgi:hypothetical protein